MWIVKAVDNDKKTYVKKVDNESDMRWYARYYIECECQVTILQKEEGEKVAKEIITI